MLRRASVSEIKSGNISKKDGLLIVTMRMYPRFLSKALVDDYKPLLSPQKDLFERYREFKKRIKDQNEAFELAQYQSEFALSREGLKDLQSLAEASKNQDVYMICQCAKDERCHVDLMLLIAQKKWGAEIGDLPYTYSRFRPLEKHL